MLQVSAPSVSVLAEDGTRSALCYTKTSVVHGSPNSPACTMLLGAPVKYRASGEEVWSFNAPIDCVNGYNCQSLRSTLRRKLSQAVEWVSEAVEWVMNA